VASELGALLGTHFADLLHVALVAHENLADAWVRKTLDLVHPLAHVVEGVSVGHIVDDDDAVSPSVVAARQGPEPLLSRCVPLPEIRGKESLRFGASLSARPALSF